MKKGSSKIVKGKDFLQVLIAPRTLFSPWMCGEYTLSNQGCLSDISHSEFIAFPAAHPAIAMPRITHTMPISLLRKKPPISHSAAATMKGNTSILQFELSNNFTINFSLLYITCLDAYMRELVIVLKKYLRVN